MCSINKYRATGFDSFRPAQINTGAATATKSQKLGLTKLTAVKASHMRFLREKSSLLMNRKAIGFAK